MSKPTRGATKAAPAKKKAKRRPEPRPIAPGAPTIVADEAVQTDEDEAIVAQAPVLQFRPRPRETTPVRSMPAKGPSARVTGFPVTDYSYVYTDLRIIAVLVGALLVALIALSFVIR